MKTKIVLLLLITTFYFNNSDASHAVGGDTRFIQTGANQFTVVFTLYRYCSGLSAPATINAKVYDNVTNAFYLSFTSIKDSSANITFGNACYSPPGLCVEEHFYSGTITLPQNPNGYFVVSPIGTRNTGLINIGNSNYLFYAQIPDPALSGGNSSPKFVQYPRDAFFCLGSNKIIDFSCTDADGDSLVYSLQQPFSDTALVGIKPFKFSSWNAGFSLTNILGPGSTCSIDRQTGLVTARPTQLGLFAISVKCEEYRSNVKIGEVIKDIQYAALSCFGDSNISLTTIVDGTTISSVQPRATYQWIDCNNGNTIIAGETDSSFTATVNGNYAVIITVGTCSDTSSCVNIGSVGMHEQSINNEFIIFPNPSENYTQIKTNSLNEKQETVVIFNSIGEIQFSQEISLGSNQINTINLKSGIYFIRYRNNLKKFIKI